MHYVCQQQIKVKASIVIDKEIRMPLVTNTIIFKYNMTIVIWYLVLFLRLH